MNAYPIFWLVLILPPLNKKEVNFFFNSIKSCVIRNEWRYSQLMVVANHSRTNHSNYVAIQGSF